MAYSGSNIAICLARCPPQQARLVDVLPLAS